MGCPTAQEERIGLEPAVCEQYLGMELYIPTTTADSSTNLSGGKDRTFIQVPEQIASAFAQAAISI
jgi:hypothetical protein